MAEFESLGRAVLDGCITAFRANKDWADKGIAQLSDEQLRQSLDPETNSVAVIMKHLAGNFLSRWTDFLTTDGEKPWRDRDAEFVDTFESRAELLAYWEQGWNCVFSALGSLTPEDLAREVTIRGEPTSVPLAMQRSLAHAGYHVGQILLIARVLVGPTWKVITVPRGGSAAFNARVWGGGHYQQRPGG